MQKIPERLSGIVQRVTYHNSDSGWSVLRVSPFNSPASTETVTVHQTQVFAGATMEFVGEWTVHAKYGRQFKAHEAIEKKPASAAALERYLGSGLIRGVGPKTAKKIVGYFGQKTLSVFEDEIHRLLEVPGIARKKLKMIEEAWRQHRAVREVMMFLQGHGISTLFAVRIYKEYGDNSIEMVRRDPYRLAIDFYGIGFFSADKVALSIGFARDSKERIVAGIRHVLSASREQGHCYLSQKQIKDQVSTLLEMNLEELLPLYLQGMERENLLKVRHLSQGTGDIVPCYYAKTLYFDEKYVADKIKTMNQVLSGDEKGIATWIKRYCSSQTLKLSGSQVQAVQGVVRQQFSVLTGGPGCGKTTTTQVIVRLFEAMHRKVQLAAPTGRAAQRMGEVIGRESKTLHRLLEWQRGRFQKSEEHPLQTDVLIVDECSMLDISLAAAVFRAVPPGCQLLFIGDADQLPSVGAGNVLNDIIAAGAVPCFRLTEVFRQARESLIIKYAHQVNEGMIPGIDSPFKKPTLWQKQTDCLFIDSDEATQEQLSFINRVKRAFALDIDKLEGLSGEMAPYHFRTEEKLCSPHEVEFVVPEKFKHVDVHSLSRAGSQVEELKAVLRKVHPWSSLHYNLTAIDIVVKLYTEWIPKYHGEKVEVQVLSPMTRGSLGTVNLNKVLQMAVNPPRPGAHQVMIGERVFREGDRVIHRRNNYDLQVFNGDIGTIISIDNERLKMVVSFSPDGREVEYKKEDIMELDLAYAITIHKSQGSEFAAVIIPVLTQHFKMLYRNLIYTGLTRARLLGIFVGTRRALAMAVHQQDTNLRQTALQELLKPEIL